MYPRIARSAARTDKLAGFREPARDRGAVVGFKGGQARRKQLATGHDDDIEAWSDVISTENLSDQTFSAVSDDRSAKPLCRRDAQAADGEPVRLREQRVVPARKAAAMLVDFLKIGVSADPLVRAELQID